MCLVYAQNYMFQATITKSYIQINWSAVEMKCVDLETLCLSLQCISQRWQRLSRETWKPQTCQCRISALLLCFLNLKEWHSKDKSLITFLASHALVDGSICRGNCDSGVCECGGGFLVLFTGCGLRTWLTEVLVGGQIIQLQNVTVIVTVWYWSVLLGSYFMLFKLLTICFCVRKHT